MSGKNYVRTHHVGAGGLVLREAAGITTGQGETGESVQLPSE